MRRRLFYGGVAALAGVAAAAVGVAILSQTDGFRRWAVVYFDNPYQAPPGPMEPRFEGADAERSRVVVRLVEVASGVARPTDVQFVPGQPGRMWVLAKWGTVHAFDLDTGDRTEVLSLDVATDSEQGLLGLAFHPDYVQNGRFFLNYVRAVDGVDHTRVAEWTLAPEPRETRLVLEVEQPYQNHNAGQLAFGPDGMLYVGLGDGGFRDDPHGNGQDLGTLLGAMLRIDVDAAADGQGYAVPPDNPFVGRDGVRPEIWAYGLRNPWRYSFAPDGRLVVADVGQNRFEEVGIVAAGSNHGWAIREARHCFAPEEGCPTAGLVDPIYEYPRADGQSVTGGYVYTGSRIPELAGRYVFGDFVQGALWAIRLPESPGGPMVEAVSLGAWPILPSAFGQDAAGELVVADFGSGRVFRIEPGSSGQ